MRELLFQYPDVICLQEVTPSMINIIKKCQILTTHKLVYDSIISYGQIFLVKNDLCPHITTVKSIIFPQSKMSRKICQLSLDNGVNILNVHLESEFKSQPSLSDIKFRQLSH